MINISGLNTGAARALTEIDRLSEVSKVKDTDKGTKERAQKPARDEYIPEEKQEPSGQYWIGKDGSGQIKVHFEDPERKADEPDTKKSEQADSANRPNSGGRKSERCVGNTDKVDREIEKLKKKKEKLEQQINTAKDEKSVKELERQLAQVERELSEKDNDTYRKQHTTFTQLS